MVITRVTLRPRAEDTLAKHTLARRSRGKSIVVMLLRDAARAMARCYALALCATKYKANHAARAPRRSRYNVKAQRENSAFRLLSKRHMVDTYGICLHTPLRVMAATTGGADTPRRLKTSAQRHASGVLSHVSVNSIRIARSEEYATRTAYCCLRAINRKKGARAGAAKDVTHARRGKGVARGAVRRCGVVCAQRA